MLEYTPGVPPGAPTAGAVTPMSISSVGWNRVNRLSSRLSGVVSASEGNALRDGYAYGRYSARPLVWLISIRTVIASPRSPGTSRGR